MKKWFLPALLALLLLTAAGCDENIAPAPELPETVDGLTLVTTTDETELPTEPETQPVTEAETEAETEAPADKTETLSAEEAVSILDAVVLHLAEQEKAPIEVALSSEVRITAHMFGFSGTSTIPLSAGYAMDGEGDLLISYAIPMEGTGVYVVTDGMLYLRDGTESALKAPLDTASIEEVKSILMQRLSAHSDTDLTGFPLPDLTNGFMGTSPVLPSDQSALTNLWALAIAAIPMEDAFKTVTAVRSVETGEVSLILSGISASLLDTMEGIASSLPETPAEEDTSASAELAAEIDYSKETALALVALLREQADTAITVTLTVDGDLNVTKASTVTALDLSALPELTANMPVELEMVTEMTFRRENVTVEAPADADLYTEVELKDLLPAVTPDEPEESTDVAP